MAQDVTAVKTVKKFKGNEFAIPIYTPRSAYNFIRQNGRSDLTRRRAVAERSCTEFRSVHHHGVKE